MEDPDPGVLAAAARGDQSCVVEIIELAQPHVWRFLRHLTDDADLAADLTQETLLRVVRSLGRFGGRSRFRTWVFAIARNVATDHFRSTARRPHAVSGADRADGVVGDMSQLAEVRAAVESLPVQLREVFVLVEVHGLRYREVGQVLEIPVGTVKSRMFHARRQLIDWFGAVEDGACVDG